MLKAERIAGPVAHHGEGPFWMRGNRRNSLGSACRCNRCVDADGDVSRYEVRRACCLGDQALRFRWFVIATERGIVGADDRLSVFERIAEVTRTRVRTNDGGCDRLGASSSARWVDDEQPEARSGLSRDARPGG